MRLFDVIPKGGGLPVAQGVIFDDEHVAVRMAQPGGPTFRYLSVAKPRRPRVGEYRVVDLRDGTGDPYELQIHHRFLWWSWWARVGELDDRDGPWFASESHAISEALSRIREANARKDPPCVVWSEGE